MALFLVLAVVSQPRSSGCVARHSPSWLPGHALAHGDIGILQKPHSHLGILCCDGILGGVPATNGHIKAWQELDGHIVPLVTLSLPAPECSTSSAPFHVSRPTTIKSRPACAALAHFPASFSNEACSMGVNPETFNIEFTKCCPGGYYGLTGSIFRKGKAGVPFWFFLDEQKCKRARCPSSTLRCNFPSQVYDARVSGCVNLSTTGNWDVHSKKTCGWPDTDYALGSHEQVVECLDQCAADPLCQSIEVLVGPPSLCIMRSQMCVKPLPSRIPIYTLAKNSRRPVSSSHARKADENLIGLMVLLVTGVVILVTGAILCINSSTQRRKNE